MSMVLSKLTEEEISELAIIIAKRNIDIGLTELSLQRGFSDF